MKVITYGSAEAPAAHAWVARLLVEKGFLPVFISASTEDGARTKAQTFWNTEIAKFAHRFPDPKTAGRAVQAKLGALDPVESSAEQIDLEEAVAAATGSDAGAVQPDASIPTDPLDDLLG